MLPDSIEALERAALSGDWGAAARLGLNYLVGRQVAPDPMRGIALIDQAARNGDALAATIASTSFWRPCNWEAALDRLQQAAERGHDAAQSALVILATGPSGSAAASRDWNELRDAVDLDAWFTPPEPRLMRESPRIEVMERFVPVAVCEWLIARARGHLARATI